MTDIVGAGLLVILPMMWGWLGITSVKRLMAAEKNATKKTYYFHLILALIFFLSILRMIELIIKGNLVIMGIKWKYGNSLLDIFGPFDIFLVSPTLIAQQVLPYWKWVSSFISLVLQILLTLLQLIWGWVGFNSIKYIFKHKPKYQTRYLISLIVAISFGSWVIFWVSNYPFF